MAGPNVGFATLSIIPSMQGIDSRLRLGLSGPLAKASGDAGSSSGSSFLSGFSGKAKAGAAAAGVVVAAVLAKGFSDALGNEVANDKFAAQLGLPPERAKELGKVSGSLYADAYGDSIGTVNEALKSVLQSGAVFEDVDNGSLEKLTAKALDLGTAFDQDVGGPAKAAGQLIRNGLAKDADEAFDIITRGFQEGADKSGDLIDTFNEYSTLFRDLGISGEAATGLLVQGLGAGARDADKVADALKEFAIRGQDASTLSAEGFELIGLNAKEMTKQVASGGPKAAAALDKVLDRLRETEDPVKRNAAAVALFGTQAEDLGDALFALDPSQAVARLGNVEGAAARLGDTLNDNTATKIESFKRTALQGLTDFIGGTVIPGVEGLVGLFQEEGFAGGLERIGQVIEEQAPIIGQKLLDLGERFVDWIGPQIEPALGAIGGWLGSITAWLLDPGLGLLGEGVAKLVPALVDWITDDVIPALFNEKDGKVWQLIDDFATWVKDDGAPAFLRGGRKLGEGIIKGIVEGFGDAFNLETSTLDLGPLGEYDVPLGIKGLATGGRAYAGTPYIVGERRPELFVPDRDGTIYPRVPDSTGVTAIGGGDRTFIQHIYNPVPEPASDSVRALRQVGRQVAA